MRISKTYKKSEWLTEGPEEMAGLKADQAREVEDLKRRHEDEVEQLKVKHERESDRQGKKDEAEAERDQQEDTLPDIEDSKYLQSIEEGKLVADDMMIIGSVVKKIQSQIEVTLKKNREAGVNFMNTLIRSAGLKSKVSAKMQSKGRLFLKQELDLEEKVDIKKVLSKVKGLDKKAAQVIASLPMPVITSMINQMGSLMAGDIAEENLEEACWDGYVQKGFKTKNGKQVPNCVPVGEDKEEQDRDVKHKDGTQPKKYYKGLDKKTKDARDAHFKKGKTGPAPGDSDAKTKPSKHTQKFKAMFGEDADTDKGLKNKAEKSGIPLGILKQVYNRGLAAYKTGHRPGATAPQWAFARVNSFITKGKGTWGGADKDLAAKVKG